MSSLVQYASLLTLKLLVNFGADVHRGHLIHHAVRRRNQDAMIVMQWLLGLGLSLNIRQYEKHPELWMEKKARGLGTPLHITVDRGEVRIVRFLLQMGADRQIEDSLERTAVDLALTRGSSDIMEVPQNQDEYNNSM